MPRPDERPVALGIRSLLHEGVCELLSDELLGDHFQTDPCRESLLPDVVCLGKVMVRGSVV